MVVKHNPHNNHFKRAQEIIDAQNTQGPDSRSPQVYLSVQLNLQLQRGADKNRENLLTAHEIAMIIPTEYEKVTTRDILLTRYTPNHTAGGGPL